MERDQEDGRAVAVTLKPSDTDLLAALSSKRVVQHFLQHLIQTKTGSVPMNETESGEWAWAQNPGEIQSLVWF